MQFLQFLYPLDPSGSISTLDTASGGFKIDLQLSLHQGDTGVKKKDLGSIFFLGQFRWTN